MNARVEPIYARSAAAFTPALLESAITTNADVFARRERHSSALFDEHRLRRRTAIELKVGDRTVIVTYQDGSIPAWVTPVLHSISERWGLIPGWDSYDAKPTELRHVMQLLNALAAVMRNSSSAPLVTPLSDGGVQAEWHAPERTLEIVVSAGEEVRYYFYSGEDEYEEEGPFEQNQARIKELIGRF